VKNYINTIKVINYYLKNNKKKRIKRKKITNKFIIYLLFIMECSICYESFFLPKSNEDYKFKNLPENLKKNSYINLSAIRNLLITDKYNSTYKCPIENCDSIICQKCWTSLLYNSVLQKKSIRNNLSDAEEGRDDDDDGDDDDLDIYYLFSCPYCRNIDWKQYMSNHVLLQLLVSKLGVDIVHEDLMKKIREKNKIFREEFVDKFKKYNSHAEIRKFK